MSNPVKQSKEYNNENKKPPRRRADHRDNLLNAGRKANALPPQTSAPGPSRLGENVNHWPSPDVGYHSATDKGLKFSIGRCGCTQSGPPPTEW
jgi:hypothetical protein